MRRTKLHSWARDFAIKDEGVARLMGVSKWTVISWRREDRDATEPENWRERVIAGLEAEVTRLKRGFPEGLNH